MPPAVPPNPPTTSANTTSANTTNTRTTSPTMTMSDSDMPISMPVRRRIRTATAAMPTRVMTASGVRIAP